VTAVYYNSEVVKNTGAHFVNDRVYLERDESKRSEPTNRHREDAVNGKSDRTNSKKSSASYASYAVTYANVAQDPDCVSIRSTHI
jgi:hypothetical protein